MVVPLWRRFPYPLYRDDLTVRVQWYAEQQGVHAALTGDLSNWLCLGL